MVIAADFQNGWENYQNVFFDHFAVTRVLE
jgi:hypothetical protein